MVAGPHNKLSKCAMLGVVAPGCSGLVFKFGFSRFGGSSNKKQFYPSKVSAAIVLGIYPYANTL
tara:strand:- start:637 stop:828 length:192 start_codon:yes stop_codon:yes gene_type:complete